MSAEKKKAWLILGGIIFVSVLLCLSIVLLIRQGRRASSIAPDKMITVQATQVIALRDKAVNTPFALSNILPGDSETKTYVLDIKNDGVLAVSFKSELVTPKNALSDALGIKVRKQGEEQFLYEGTAKDMPTLRVPRIVGETMTALEVTVYLTASATNACANKMAEISFSFWVAEGDLLPIDEENKDLKVWPFLLGGVGILAIGLIALSEPLSYGGGLGLTIGTVDIDGVIAYDLSTNHNTAYLTADFNGFSFTVNEADEHFVNFNFKPAAGYTYTEGDEAKLVCLNEGYSTYWDAATSTFRLQAD